MINSIQRTWTKWMATIGKQKTQLASGVAQVIKCLLFNESVDKLINIFTHRTSNEWPKAQFVRQFAELQLRIDDPPMRRNDPGSLCNITNNCKGDYWRDELQHLFAARMRMCVTFATLPIYVRTYM